MVDLRDLRLRGDRPGSAGQLLQAHFEIQDARNPPDFSDFPPPGQGGPPPEEIERRRLEFIATHEISRRGAAQRGATSSPRASSSGCSFVMLIGTLVVTNEFFHQTATTTFLTTPHAHRGDPGQAGGRGRAAPGSSGRSPRADHRRRHASSSARQDVSASLGALGGASGRSCSTCSAYVHLGGARRRAGRADPQPARRDADRRPALPAQPCRSPRSSSSAHLELPHQGGLGDPVDGAPARRSPRR